MAAAGYEASPLKQEFLPAAMRLVSMWQGHPQRSAGRAHFVAGSTTAVSPPANALSPAASHSQSVTQQYPAAETATGLQWPVSEAACEACDRVEQVAQSILQQVRSIALLISGQVLNSLLRQRIH